MHILAITPLGKRKCKVLTDEGFAFPFYRGEIRDRKLEEGAELTEAAWEAIRTEILLPRARERCFYLLKDRDRTTAEIRRKLREGSYPESVIEETIDRLKEYHYLDDRRYAEHYLEICRERRSLLQIRQTLQQRGISREILEDLTAREDREQEAGQIRSFLLRHRYTRDTDEKEQRKIVAALMRRGYSYEQIRSAMREAETD